MVAPFTLDASQRAVVESAPDRALRVLGGPGTGKTTALIERAAWLAEQPGWGPDNVLVLAGNRIVAAELRDRLALRLARTSSGPLARTVASVAFQIVSAQTERPVTLLTGAEHDSVLSELLAGEIEDNRDGYWPASFGRELRSLRGFRTELREFIMRMEERGITSSELRTFARSAERPEWSAIAEFIDRSIAPQAAAHPDQYDSAELVAFAARIIHDGATVSGLEHVRAVLVDDAQDATESTVSLLRAWAGRGIHVSVAGDPDVASNGFRGGQSDLIGNMAQVLGGTEVTDVILAERYRSPEPIRREYARVVQAIGTRGVTGQRERIAAGEPLREGPHWNRLLSASAYTEARAIADELRTRHVLDGVPWGDLAVVTRSTRYAQSLETTLARMGVPTGKNVARQVLRDDAGARWLLDAAAFVYRFGRLNPEERAADTASLLALLGGPLGGLDAIELRRLRLQLRAESIELLETVQHPVELEMLDGPVAKRAGSACRTLADALKHIESGSIEDVLWSLWSGSVAATTWTRDAGGRGALADEANAALDGVVALFAAAKRFVERRPRESGSLFVAEQFDSAIPEDVITGDGGRRSVTVATPSQVVGREFDTVVIAGLVDGIWPNLRPRFSLLHADELLAIANGAEIDTSHTAERAAVRSDEYRLFALALSRARTRVVLSAHIGEDNAVSVLFGDTSQLAQTQRTPTRLRDLVGVLRRQLVRSTDRNGPTAPFAEALKALSAEGVPGANPSDWYGLTPWSTSEPLHSLEQPDAPIRVSPSTVEKVENSSLAWFVDLYAPGPSSDSQATGIIIHSALEELGTTPGVSLDEFVEFVEPRLAELPQDAGWARAQTQRRVRVMLERLCQYLEQSAAQGRTFIAAEARFTLELGPIVVNGSIDRVERTDAGAYYVVDLKTGKDAVSVDQAEESAQMQCYQLAIHDGVVTGVPEGETAGAALLYIQTKNQTPTIRAQQPLTDEAVLHVRERIEAAAERMSGPQFEDFEVISDRGATAARRYRIQVIPGVCA